MALTGAAGATLTESLAHLRKSASVSLSRPLRPAAAPAAFIACLRRRRVSHGHDGARWDGLNKALQGRGQWQTHRRMSCEISAKIIFFWPSIKSNPTRSHCEGNGRGKAAGCCAGYGGRVAGARCVRVTCDVDGFEAHAAGQQHGVVRVVHLLEHALHRGQEHTLPIHQALRQVGGELW